MIQELRRMTIRLALLTMAVQFVGSQTMSVAQAEGLKKGDRVVFLGDSITQAGAAPGGYVTLVAKDLAEKQPDLGIEVIGAGISGNRVPDLEKRLQKDVLDRKPTVVVIYIGINDVWHWQNGRGTTKEDFTAGLKRIIGKITDQGARVILCTASVIGEKYDGSNPQDKMLAEYCQLSREVAQETKSQLLDLNKAFLGHLKSENKDNADKNILTSDGVHLNPAGNRFVADHMLQALSGAAQAGKVLRHVVLFKFKEEVTPGQVKEVEAAFAALPSQISQICGFEWGTDVSVENKSEGFTHGFVVSFHDAQGRDEYLPHPAHQEFVKLVGPLIDKVLVFDFWVQ
ncbi:MAG: GDSL-type esterase/lipase family protein [Pirellulales bacterium]